MQRRQKPRTNEKQELQRKLAFLMVRWRAKCTIGCQAAWKPSGLGLQAKWLGFTSQVAWVHAWVLNFYIVLLMYC